MKTTKRIIAAVLMVMTLLSVLAFPASAEYVNDFPHFPVANIDYANVYKPQAVAVQRFLMSYKAEYRDDIVAHKGANGYFGTATERCTKKFQALKGLTNDGRVGPATWTEIGNNLNEVGVDSVGPVFYCNGYMVLFIVTQNNRSGYAAQLNNGNLTEIFYYI